MATGIFSLRKVYIKQNQNIDNRNFVSWPESATYGYFGGGYVPPALYYSTIDRLDFSNETVSVPTPKLSIARRQLAATSNSSYGYFGGGFTGPSMVSTIDRLDFSNETVSTPTPKLSIARAGVAAVSSSSYGYFGGGENSPSLYFSTIDRLDFSNETVSTPTPKLSSSRQELAATSSSSYGYFAGGRTYAFPPVTLSTIDRLDFSNETVSTPTPKLSSSRRQLAATSSNSYGYFAGGSTNTFPPAASVCTIDRLDFSNETVSQNPSGLPATRFSLAAVSNSN